MTLRRYGRVAALRFEGEGLVVKGEQEMVRKTEEKTPEARREERFTSLQPTYEDSVPPDEEDDWEHEG